MTRAPTATGNTNKAPALLPATAVNVTGAARDDLDPVGRAIADALVESLAIIDVAALPPDLRAAAFDRTAAEIIPRRIAQHSA